MPAPRRSPPRPAPPRRAADRARTHNAHHARARSSTIVCQYQSSDDDDGLQFERCEHAIVPASVTPMRQRCVTFHTENEVELEKRQDELIFGVNFNVSFDFSNSQGNGVPTRVLLYGK